MSPEKAQNEMIADFVGDELFKDDGSKLTTLLAHMEVKQRRPFMQFLTDFFRYIKSKLQGGKVPFEVMRLERRFSNMLRTVGGNPQAETKQSIPDNNINEVNNSEESEENRNSGMVQGVSSNGGSQDVLRESGNDSGKNDTGLGNTTASIEGYARSRNKSYGQFRTAFSKGQGYVESLLGSLSKRRIATVDSVGRKVNTQILNQFNKTALKNDKGEIIPFFHSTTEKFTSFTIGDIGFHFGLFEQAKKRAETKGQQAFYKEAYINSTRPFVINKDTMSWDAMCISYELLQQGIIDDSELNNIATLDGYYRGAYESEAAKKIREILKSKGFDSIVYPNGFEGEGASIIVFDNSQIFQIAEYVDNGDGTMTEIDIDTSDAENENQYSIPAEASALLERYEKGEISREEYITEQQKLITEGIEQYGKIEPGENPQVEANVPKKVTDDKNVKRFIRTIIETGELSDADLEAVSTDVLLGNFSYDIISDDSALKYADDKVKAGLAKSDWEKTVANGILWDNNGKRKVAVGERLLQQAMKDGDTKRILELSAELSEIFTRAGQVERRVS